MISRSSNRPGFTLVEVLITVGILSTVVIFIFHSFTALLSAVRFSQEITLACYLAEGKLWQIEQAGLKGYAFPESGQELVQKKDYNWFYEISDTISQDLKKVKLTVSWKRKTSEKDYNLDFYTYFLPKQ